MMEGLTPRRLTSVKKEKRKKSREKADQYLTPLCCNEQPGCPVDSRAKVVCPACGGVGANLGHVPGEDPNLQPNAIIQ